MTAVTFANDMTEIGCIAVDVLPTLERRQHGGFETKAGITRTVSTLTALYEAGDIGDDEVEAAMRWQRDFLYAKFGTVDRSVGATVQEKGDVHTWMLSRGKASLRISKVRESLGMCVHVRLQMMLNEEKSFSAMARVLFPKLSEARARMKVSAQCALILEQLSAYYDAQRKNRVLEKNVLA